MLLIDNGSTDNTCKIIKELCKNDKRVFGVKNLKNYGSELSMSHGLDLAVKSSSDFIIMMCSDLQDPPEQCVEMIKEWKNGNDIVISYRKSHTHMTVNRFITYKKNHNKTVLFMIIYKFWIIFFDK